MAPKIETKGPLALTAPLARAVPPAGPASAPMARHISQPFRPSASNLALEDEYAAAGLESPYVATWVEAQKQREREWLCWHLRNEGLKPPQPMPLPTAGTASRPGSPPTNRIKTWAEWEGTESCWARFKRFVRCDWG